MDPILFVVLFIVAAVVVALLMGIRIVRPTNRGLIERPGRYRRFAKGGFNWIIPLVDRMIQVNITEPMVDAQPQEIITNDNLNARVEAEAIRLVNEAANTYFVGNAQLLRKLEALEKSLSQNAKIVIPSGSELVNVIGEMAGFLPMTK